MKALSEPQEELLKELKKTGYEKIDFVEIIPDSEGGKEVIFERTDEQKGRVVFYLDEENTLCIVYSTGKFLESSKMALILIEKNSYFLQIFNPIWESYKNHFKLKVRLLFS